MSKRKRQQDSRNYAAFFAARGEPAVFINSGFSHVDGSALSAHASMDMLTMSDGLLSDAEVVSGGASLPIVVQLGLDAENTARATEYASLMRLFPALEGSAFPTAAQLACFEPLCDFISMRVHRWPAASVPCMSLAQLVDLVCRPGSATAAATPYMVAVACVKREIAHVATWTVANMGRLSAWKLHASMWDCVVPHSLKARTTVTAVTTRGTDDVLTAILEVARLANIPVMTHGCTTLLPYVGAYMDTLYTLPKGSVDACTVPVCMLLSRMLETYPDVASALVLARTSDVLDSLCLPVKACAPTPTLLFGHLDLCSILNLEELDAARAARMGLLQAEFEPYAWMFVCACVHTGHRKLTPFCLSKPWTAQTVPCKL